MCFIAMNRTQIKPKSLIIPNPLSDKHTNDNCYIPRGYIYNNNTESEYIMASLI